MSQQGWAETAKLKAVRTGEHENFTRIVFEFQNAVQFKTSEVIGKGKFSVLFYDSSTDLSPLAAYETDALQKVQSIEFNKNNLNLTANVTLTFPYFKLKAFSLSNPDRIVVDAYKLSASSEGSILKTSLNSSVSSQVSKTLEKKEDVNIQVSSPAKKTSKQSAEPLNIQKSVQQNPEVSGKEKSAVQSSMFSDYFSADGGERKLIPSIALREEYNDNIFLSEDEEDDFITTITPSLRFQRRTERFNGRLGARLDVLSYADLDELNHVDQAYNGGIGYQFTSLLNVSTNVLYQKDSRPDRDIVETGLVLGDEVRERRQFGTGMTYTLSEISQATLSFQINDDDYDDPESYDSLIYQIQALYTRDLSRRLPNTVGRIICSYGRYEYDQVQYGESQTILETRKYQLSRSTDVDSYQLMLGISKDWNEGVNLLLDIGGSYTVTEFTDTLDEQIDNIFYGSYSRTTSSDDEQKKWGGVGQLVLTFTGEKTTTHLTLSQQVSGASGRSGASQRTAAIVDVSQRLTYKLKSSLSAGYYFNKIDQSSDETDADEEETFRLSGSLRYNFTNDVYIDGGYRFILINDKVEDKTKQRNAVFVQIGIVHDLLD
jgi:hypothetical protein